MSVNEVKLKKAPEAFVVRGTKGPPSSRTFCIGDEDHTLGNAVRHVLARDSEVAFAGYSVPHPSEPVVQIRIQTVKKAGGRGEAPPAIDKFKVACQTLHEQCNIVLDKWEELLPEVREDRIRMEALLLEEADEADEEEEGGDDGNSNNAMEGVEKLQ